jgi:D-3-phosphoglycerate dehydrogenase / 2-oxoglutarate reductase
VSEARVSRSEDFISLLSFKVITEKKEHVVEGTLFGRSEPRMCRFGAYRGEFDLAGDLIVINALDKPGLIGKVGSTLGGLGINISHLQFARQKQGGEAIVFLNTDSRPNKKAIEALESMESVLGVRRLRF